SALSPAALPSSTTAGSVPLCGERSPASVSISRLIGRKHDGDTNIAADAGRIERNAVVMTAHAQVDARLPKPEIVQHDLVEKSRQAWIAQADLAIEGIEIETERSFEQGERRGACPSLWRTGDRIERRTLA